MTGTSNHTINALGRNRNLHVLIAGAGIGGLTAALALLRRGARVTVLEQAPQLGEVGAGLQVSANGTRILHLLGLGDALAQIATRPARKIVRLWNTGQTWNLFDLGGESVVRFGYPYYTVYRADLHRILAEAVARLDPHAIVLGEKCIDVRHDAHEAIVDTASGGRYRADVVIGADGVHSRVRGVLFGDDHPDYSGILAWRGVIPAAALPDHLREPCGVNWVGPGAHVIHYPLRGGQLVNFVGAVERSDWEVESWTQRGTVEECLADFEHWHPDVRTLVSAIETPYKWALMVREPMTNWTRGRLTLLGDACHPTLPFLAQGAVMAIEDGYVLARCLDKWAADPEVALQHYQRARIDRTARVVRGSADNAARFHNPALANAEGAANYVATEWNESRVRERYEWMFEYDAETVEL
ncbi:FAD-dependent monooxygenase [Paraburkholderia sp. D15]|uniref:FAD-dependent monooxygenase n=1 Tax=Paraburkholderia sp. D15 TaxID=2880218 RepID=UPI00247AB219|nr:FAD-dependent monooxygenase [Paraburkholderia sp. D15]WGS50743.1 FAD-dependent monooxygenase [Paraburkholderia sp. D15]